MMSWMESPERAAFHLGRAARLRGEPLSSVLDTTPLCDRLDSGWAPDPLQDYRVDGWIDAEDHGEQPSDEDLLRLAQRVGLENVSWLRFVRSGKSEQDLGQGYWWTLWACASRDIYRHRGESMHTFRDVSGWDPRPDNLPVIPGIRHDITGADAFKRIARLLHLGYEPPCH